MEDLIDLIVTDASPSELSSSIKNILYSKAAEKIDSIRPQVAELMFNSNEDES